MNNRYRNITYWFILFSGLLVVYSPILPDLYHLWIKYNNNSHGILVPFISLYLIWKERKNIDWSKAEQSNHGLIVLIFSLFVYIVGYAGGIEILPRLAMVASLIGLVLYNLGGKIFSRIAFPLLFLFFMIPVPVSIVNIVSFPLQICVTKISSWIITSLSISVLREGNMLHFANTSLEVAEACSGIRSLTAYIMLGFLFAYLIKGSYIKKAIMVLVSIPLSFIVNIMRVTGTGILAHFFGGKVARGFLHEFSGLSVFALGFIFLFLFFIFLEENKKQPIKNMPDYEQ